jgi:5'-nucleotidase
VTLALITNDDGIDSPGLVTLAEAALAAGLDITVAAPSWDTSGASASLTGVRQDGRLIVERRQLPGLDVAAFSVEGAPAMIAVTALRGGFGAVPDIVLSGVNRGRNTGHAVLHSGTVGAALTGVNYCAGGLAVSIDAASPRWWATAGRVAVPVIAWLAEHRPGYTINLNVPDVAAEDLAGVRTAPLAAMGAVQTNVTEVGAGYVQLTFDPLPHRPDPGTDAALLGDRWAVLTAIEAITETIDDRLDRLAASVLQSTTPGD